AQAEVDRMAQLYVRRPLGELDLRDQLGADPVGTLVGFRTRVKWTLARRARFQQLHHALELAFVEAGAGVSDVGQHAVFVHAKQQRAEVRAGLPRLGPPAYHEFLLVDDLDLPPIRCALARLVRRIG